MSKNIQNPKILYKHLLRLCDSLPKSASGYYRAAIRREFDTHRDETDQERVGQIMERAVKDADWVVKKYTK